MEHNNLLKILTDHNNLLKILSDLVDGYEKIISYDLYGNMLVLKLDSGTKLKIKDINTISVKFEDPDELELLVESSFTYYKK